MSIFLLTYGKLWVPLNYWQHTSRLKWFPRNNFLMRNCIQFFGFITASFLWNQFEFINELNPVRKKNAKLFPIFYLIMNTTSFINLATDSICTKYYRLILKILHQRLSWSPSCHVIFLERYLKQSEVLQDSFTTLLLQDITWVSSTYFKYSNQN